MMVRIYRKLRTRRKIRTHLLTSMASTFRQDGTEALRHHGCPAEDNETVLGSRVEDPDFDENYADAVDQHFKCYVCREAVDALWTRLHPPLNERPAE